MNRTLRLGSIALAAIVVVVVTGCGARGGPEAIEDPRPPTTTTTSRPGTEPVTDPGTDEEVVWQEATIGGFAPTLTALSEVPDVTIYRDGRIIVTVPNPDVGAERPAVLAQAKVSAEELTGFLDEAVASRLFEPGTDFGSPGVTDQPSTTVMLRAGATPQTVDVYALDFDIPEGDLGGVSGDQQTRRTQLKDLLATARSLATDGKAYDPERVRATYFELGPGVDPPDGAHPWPGPAFSAFPEPSEGSGRSCLVIEGGEAHEVYAAAQADPQPLWERDGEVRQIVIAPLLPGQEGCAPG